MKLNTNYNQTTRKQRLASVNICTVTVCNTAQSLALAKTASQITVAICCLKTVQKRKIRELTVSRLHTKNTVYLSFVKLASHGMWQHYKQQEWIFWTLKPKLSENVQRLTCKLTILTTTADYTVPCLTTAMEEYDEVKALYKWRCSAVDFCDWSVGRPASKADIADNCNNRSITETGYLQLNGSRYPITATCRSNQSVSHISRIQSEPISGRQEFWWQERIGKHVAQTMNVMMLNRSMRLTAIDKTEHMNSSQ